MSAVCFYVVRNLKLSTLVREKVAFFAFKFHGLFRIKLCKAKGHHTTLREYSICNTLRTELGNN